MKSTHDIFNVGVAAPIRRRRLPVPKRGIFAGRRVSLAWLVVRPVAAFLLLVFALAVFATFAPTAVFYFGLALVILALPAILPYLVVQIVVAVIER